MVWFLRQNHVPGERVEAGSDTCGACLRQLVLAGEKKELTKTRTYVIHIHVLRD